MFFPFKHVQVLMKEPSVEGSGNSATDPIMIDCSPAKYPATDKASKIVSIDSSPEPTKAKYLGYSGYGSVIAKMRAGSGKSAMTKTLSDREITIPDFPKKEHHKSSDPSSHSTEDSSKSSEESEEEIQYYNNDPRFPLFSSKRRRFEAEEVLGILSKYLDKGMKCQHQPSRVQCDAAFLIDARFVPLEDGNGTYVYIGRPTQTLKKKQTVNGRKEVQNVQKSTKSQIFILFESIGTLRTALTFAKQFFTQGIGGERF